MVLLDSPSPPSKLVLLPRGPAARFVRSLAPLGGHGVGLSSPEAPPVSAGRVPRTGVCVFVRFETASVWGVGLLVPCLFLVVFLVFFLVLCVLFPCFHLPILLYYS